MLRSSACREELQFQGLVNVHFSNGVFVLGGIFEAASVFD